MPAPLDLMGCVFGKLTVLHASGKDARGAILWLCRCECGRKTSVRGSTLKARKTSSCHSCAARFRNRTHGQSKSALYIRWQAMLARTSNQNNPEFHNYGGRGISVCDGWRESFEEFARDMGPEFNELLELDRINVNGNYTPNNCRWVSHREQQRNRRNNRILTLHGRSQCVVEWAEEIGVKANTLQTRLRRGWPIERVLLEIANG